MSLTPLTWRSTSIAFSSGSFSEVGFSFRRDQFDRQIFFDRDVLELLHRGLIGDCYPLGDGFVLEFDGELSAGVMGVGEVEADFVSRGFVFFA